MKKLFVLLAILCGLGVQAQQPDTSRVPQKVYTYMQYASIVLMDGGFRIPQDTFKLKVKDSGAIAFKGGKMWVWNGGVWGSNSGLVPADTSAMLLAYRNALNVRVRYTDTSSMLSAYQTALLARLRLSDTSNMLTNYRNTLNGKVSYVDTAVLFTNYRNAINARLKFTDTSSLLTPYQNAINLRVRYSDTSSMLTAYRNALNAIPSNATVVKYTDTTSMLSAYQVGLNARTVAIALKLNISDTSGMLSAYRTALLARVRYTDTTSMLTAYANGLNARTAAIALKMSYTDTATMLAAYQAALNLTGKLSATQTWSGVNTFSGNVILSGATPYLYFGGATATDVFLVKNSGAPVLTLYKGDGSGWGEHRANVFTTLGAFSQFTVGRQDNSAQGAAIYSAAGDFSIYLNALGANALVISTAGNATFAGTVISSGSSGGIQAKSRVNGNNGGLFWSNDDDLHFYNFAMGLDVLIFAKTTMEAQFTANVKAPSGLFNASSFYASDYTFQHGDGVSPKRALFQTTNQYNIGMRAGTGLTMFWGTENSATPATLLSDEYGNEKFRIGYNGKIAQTAVTGLPDSVAAHRLMIDSMYYSYQQKLSTHVGFLEATFSAGNALQGTGIGVGATGTGTARSVSAGNFTQYQRVGYVTTAGVGAIAGIRNGYNSLYLGNAVGRGGFMFSVTFGNSSSGSIAGLRGICGMTTNTAAESGEPGTLTNVAMFAFGSGTSTWKFMNNDGSGGCDSVDLGAAFPTNTQSADMYEFRIWAKGNEQKVYYQAINKVTGAETRGSVTSNLPTSTTMLGHQVTLNTGVTNAQVAIDVVSVYLAQNLGLGNYKWNLNY